MTRQYGAAMHIEEIEYTAAGRDLIGTFAVDDFQPGPRPAVLVCHEGPGIDGHVKGRAIRLASLGYAAFALDYHGGGQPLSLEDTMPRLGELMGDPAQVRALGGAGLDVLLARPEVDADRVAAMGFCFGGSMVLELARAGLDLKAVIGFHPGLGGVDVEAARSIRASVLMFCGAADTLIGKAARDAFEAEMTEAEVADWRLEVLGGVGHSFTNVSVDEIGIPGVAWDERADRRCWRTALALLEETIGAPTR
jgi:dienelactone hydrolase